MPSVQIVPMSVARRNRRYSFRWCSKWLRRSRSRRAWSRTDPMGQPVNPPANRRPRASRRWASYTPRPRKRKAKRMNRGGILGVTSVQVQAPRSSCGKCGHRRSRAPADLDSRGPRKATTTVPGCWRSTAHSAVAARGKWFASLTGVMSVPRAVLGILEFSKPRPSVTPARANTHCHRQCREFLGVSNPAWKSRENWRG